MAKQTIIPEYILHAVEQQIRRDIRAKLAAVADEVVEKVVDKLAETLHPTMVEYLKDPETREQLLRITLERK